MATFQWQFNNAHCNISITTCEKNIKYNQPNNTTALLEINKIWFEGKRSKINYRGRGRRRVRAMIERSKSIFCDKENPPKILFTSLLAKTP